MSPTKARCHAHLFDLSQWGGLRHSDDQLTSKYQKSMLLNVEETGKGPTKWPRITNRKRTHQKKCRQQPAVPSPRLLESVRHIFLMLFWLPNLLRTLQAVQTHAAMASRAFKASHDISFLHFLNLVAKETKHVSILVHIFSHKYSVKRYTSSWLHL